MKTIILNLQNSDSEITLGTQTSTTYTITNDDTIMCKYIVSITTTSESKYRNRLIFSHLNHVETLFIALPAPISRSEVSTPESATIRRNSGIFFGKQPITLSGENDVATDGNQMANIITGNVTYG